MKILHTALLILALAHSSLSFTSSEPMQPTNVVETTKEYTTTLALGNHCSESKNEQCFIETKELKPKNSTFIQANKGKIILGSLVAGIALSVIYRADIRNAYIRLLIWYTKIS